jgi:hypothetical protein
VSTPIRSRAAKEDARLAAAPVTSIQSQREETSERADIVLAVYPRRRFRVRAARGGVYTFGGGKGSRTGSGLSSAMVAPPMGQLMEG